MRVPHPFLPNFLFFSFARTFSENTRRVLIQRLPHTPFVYLLVELTYYGSHFKL